MTLFAFFAWSVSPLAVAPLVFDQWGREGMRMVGPSVYVIGTATGKSLEKGLKRFVVRTLMETGDKKQG